MHFASVPWNAVFVQMHVMLVAFAQVLGERDEERHFVTQAGTLALALAAALVAVAVLLAALLVLLDAAKVWPTKARTQKERGMKVLTIMVAFFFSDVEEGDEGRGGKERGC
jgi:uncharacterized membrane protein